MFVRHICSSGGASAPRSPSPRGDGDAADAQGVRRSRRRWAQVLALGCARRQRGVERTARSYPQGVASGDPAHDSVILWTRRAPDESATSYRLTVEIARDTAFSARCGARRHASERRHGLDLPFPGCGPAAGAEYWYRFTDERGNGSRVGRTLTAPPMAMTVRCASRSYRVGMSNGALNAYRRMV